MDRLKLGLIPRLQKFIGTSPLPKQVREYLAHSTGPLTVYYWLPLAFWPMLFVNAKEIVKPVSHTSLGQQIGILSTCVAAFIYRYDLVPQAVRTRLDLMIFATVGLGFTSVIRIIQIMGNKTIEEQEKKVDRKMLLQNRANKRLPVKKKEYRNQAPLPK